MSAVEVEVAGGPVGAPDVIVLRGFVPMSRSSPTDATIQSVSFPRYGEGRISAGPLVAELEREVMTRVSAAR